MLCLRSDAIVLRNGAADGQRLAGGGADLMPTRVPPQLSAVTSCVMVAVCLRNRDIGMRWHHSRQQLDAANEYLLSCMHHHHCWHYTRLTG